MNAPVRLQPDGPPRVAELEGLSDDEASGLYVDEDGRTGWYCRLCNKRRIGGRTGAGSAALLQAHLTSPIHRYRARRVARGFRPW